MQEITHTHTHLYTHINPKKYPCSGTSGDMYNNVHISIICIDLQPLTQMKPPNKTFKKKSNMEDISNVVYI